MGGDHQVKRSRFQDDQAAASLPAEKAPDDTGVDGCDDFEQRALALVMGLSPRLGSKSFVRHLNDELVRLIILRNFAHPIQISDKLKIKGEHVANLQNWIESPLNDVHLLYLASRDGWSGPRFHKLCDGRGPTLSVVFCRTGHIFGGFASLPWSCSGKEHSDPKAFIFSLSAGNDDPHRPPMICPQSGYAPEYAVYHGRYTFCPCFGYALALDLSRPDRCRSDFNQGAIYNRPTGPRWYDHTFLAGQREQWEIDDVAVLRVGPAIIPDPADDASSAHFSDVSYPQSPADDGGEPHPLDAAQAALLVGAELEQDGDDDLTSDASDASVEGTGGPPWFQAGHPALVQEGDAGDAEAGSGRAPWLSPEEDPEPSPTLGLAAATTTAASAAGDDVAAARSPPASPPCCPCSPPPAPSTPSSATPPTLPRAARARPRPTG